MTCPHFAVCFVAICLAMRGNALDAEAATEANAIPEDIPAAESGPESPAGTETVEEAEVPQQYPKPVSVDVNEFLSESEIQVEAGEEGSPRIMTSYVISQDPTIKVTANFLSDEEMQHLIEISKLNWKSSEVGVHSDGALVDDQDNFKSSVSDYRNSSSSLIDYSQTPIVAAIEERLAMLAGVDVNYIEQLAMVRYRPGEVFKEHHDGGFRSSTVFIYLNDLPDDDGGETLFPALGLKFLPRRGCAVMWSNINQAGEPNSMMIHQGLPPKTGTKYAVNVFFNSKPQRKVGLEAKALDSIVARSDEWTVVDADVLGGAEKPPHGTVNTFMVFEEPKLFVIPQLLLPDEVRALLSFVYPEETPPSQEILDGIFARVEAVMGAPRSSFKVSATSIKSDMAAERMGAEGEVARMHLVIFLTEDFERGELLFPGLEARVRPRLGSGVLWSTSEDAEDPRLEAINAPPSSKDGAIADRCTVVFRAASDARADEVEDAPAPIEESE